MSRKRRTVVDEPFVVVRTSASDLRDGSLIAEHVHDWHQLIYVRTGLMIVRTTAGSWITSPDSAVWVPAGTEHSIRFAGRSALRTCYLLPGSFGGLPDDCRALHVTPLLRELVVRATEIGMLDSRDLVEAAVGQLIVAELDRPGPRAFVLPEPSGPLTCEAARLIATGSRAAAATASLARAVGLGQRTLERRFEAETGLTVGRWRQQHALLAGLERIAGGMTVTEAATVAGYSSASAYIAAFRKVFGVTPAQYF